jgi:hypothetical protein
MADITPGQARLAVEVAGLDPGKPLTEQLSPQVNEEQVKTWDREAVQEAAEHRGSRLYSISLAPDSYDW